MDIKGHTQPPNCGVRHKRELSFTSSKIKKTPVFCFTPHPLKAINQYSSIMNKKPPTRTQVLDQVSKVWPTYHLFDGFDGIYTPEKQCWELYEVFTTEFFPKAPNSDDSKTHPGLCCGGVLALLIQDFSLNVVRVLYSKNRIDDLREKDHQLVITDECMLMPICNTENGNFSDAKLQHQARMNSLRKWIRGIEDKVLAYTKAKGITYVTVICYCTYAVKDGQVYFVLDYRPCGRIFY